MKEYNVERGYTVNQLIECVDRGLQQGWELYGSMVFAHHEGGFLYCQPMTKEVVE